MTQDLKISLDLQARVDSIAARSSRSAEDVIADALENGHSLDWQERFIEKVSAGLVAADSGQFASQADVHRVLNKYRPR